MIEPLHEQYTDYRNSGQYLVDERNHIINQLIESIDDKLKIEYNYDLVKQKKFLKDLIIGIDVTNAKKELESISAQMEELGNRILRIQDDLDYVTECFPDV